MATPKSLQEATTTARNSVIKKDAIGTQRVRDQEGTLHETLEYRESAIRENNGKRLSLSLSLSLQLDFFHPRTPSHIQIMSSGSHSHSVTCQDFFIHESPPHIYLDQNFRKIICIQSLPRFFIHEFPPHICLEQNFRQIICIQ